MTAQFVEIAGAQMVLLTREEFNRLSDAAEHYDDIVAAVEAQKRREAGEEYIPADVVGKLVAGENPLKVWRKYRGFTLRELAEKVGHQDSFISKLETGRSEGGVKLWQQLAKALDVDLEDLIPSLD
jgi:DNA-binding XRE family transcriptional regulator